MKAVQPAASRIPELDGLRAFAILAVFLHHSLGVPLLWMGVDLFFVLSGFLITGILLRRKESGQDYFGHFYARRARRILPPYAASLALVTVLFGAAWTRHWYWFAFFATNIGAMKQQLILPALAPLWSLAVEEQFYFFWPVVVLLTRERVLAVIAAALVLFSPIARAICTPLFSTHMPIYYLTPFRMDPLAAGALLALVWKNFPQAIPRLRTIAMAVGGVTALALCGLSIYPWFRAGSNNRLSNALVYSLVLVISTAALTVALSGQGLVGRVLRLPALRYVGIISYSMYLVHVSMIVAAGSLTRNRAAMFALALAATIAYSTVTWFSFERQLLKH